MVAGKYIRTRLLGSTLFLKQYNHNLKKKIVSWCLKIQQNHITMLILLQCHGTPYRKDFNSFKNADWVGPVLSNSKAGNIFSPLKWKEAYFLAWLHIEYKKYILQSTKQGFLTIHINRLFGLACLVHYFNSCINWLIILYQRS